MRRFGPAPRAMLVLMYAHFTSNMSRNDGLKEKRSDGDYGISRYSKQAMGNIESASNPYGFGEHERADWASDLDVKIGQPAEYIYRGLCCQLR